MSDTVDRMGKYVDFESQLRSRINDDSFYSIPVNERGNYVAGLIEGFSKINNLNEDDKDYIGKLAEEQLTDFRISNNIPRFVPTQEQAAELFDRFPDTSTDERVEDVERKVDAWKASSLAKASALRPAEREDIETYLNRSSNNFIREEAARLNDTGWFMDKGYRAIEELAKPFHQLLDPDGSDRFWAKSAPENPSYDQDFTSLIAGGIGQVIPQIAISIGLTAAGSPEAIPAVFTALYGAEYMQNGYREEFARSGDEGKAWDNAVSQIPAALLETVGDTLLVRGVTKTARQFGKEFASASTMEAKKAILREALPTMGKAAKEGFIAEAFVGGMAAEWASGYGSYLATGDENYLRSTKDIIKGGLAEGIVGGLTAGLLHGVTNDSTRKAFAQDVSTLTGLKVKQEEIYAALKNGDFQKVIDITNKDIITDPAQQDATLDVVDKARAAINGKPITEEEKAATPKASSLVIPSTTRVKIRQDIENIDKELSDPSVTEERSNELNKRKQYLTDVNEKINNGTYEELNEVKGTVDTTSVYRNHEAIGKNDKGLTTQEITLDNGERFSYTTDDIPVFLQSNTFKQTLNGIVARFGQENVTVDLAATSGNAVIKWTEDGKKKHSQGFPYTRTPRKGFTPLTLNENGTLKIHNPINEIKYAGNARNVEVISDDTANNIITVKNKKGETITLDGERANTLRASIPNYKPEEVAKEKAEDTKPKEKKASVVDNSAQEKLTFERGNVPIVADGERRFLHKETNKMGVVVKDNGTLLFKPDDNSTPIELGGAESQITLNDAGLTRELDVRTPTEVDTNDIVDILEHEQIQSEKQSKPTTTVDKKAATKRFNDFINEFKSKFNSNSAQSITQAFNLQKNLLSRLFDLGIEVSVIDSSESIANSHAYHSEGKIYFVADRVNEAYPEGAPVALFELGLIHESAHAGTYLLEKQDPELYISAKENFLQNKELNDLMVAEYPGYETLSEDNKFYEGVRAIIEGRLKGRTTGLAKGGKFAEFLNKLLNYIRNTLFTSRDKIVFQFVSNVEDVLGVTPSVEFANNNITVNGIPSNIVSDFATIVYTKPNSEGISELISSYSKENLRLLAGMMRLNQSGTKQDLIDRIVSYKPVSENPFFDNSIMESRSQPLDAGGGFVFLMAEPTLDNKIGKHTIPRNGIVSEELFQKIGTGTSEIIPAHELAFYKELVPNAFTKEGVDLFALYDGLKEANNSISVFTYGQEADSPERRLQAELTHNWLEKLSSEKQLAYRGSPDFTKYPSYLEELRKQGFSDDDLLKAQQLQKVSRLVSEEKDSGLRATSYYNQISPFDTKKFPPVRIDVVLPNYNTSVDNLHTNIKGTVVWSMVQIVPHPRTGKKVAFIAELQSLAAQARRDQMKSLKSSIEQIEDRVKNGNLDRTAADKLIQSQKDAADAIAPDHPVLPVHQSLGLKAVIKWVKEQNQKAIAEGRPEDVIDEVAVSDGETAMMTEGHDKAAERTYQESDIGKWSVRDSVTNREYNIYPTKANAELQAKDIQTRTGNPQVLKEITKEDTALRVSQEGGMRLAYDVTLPSIVKKLTRDNGTAMDFGPHKNAQKEETFDEVRAREAAGWSSEAGFPSLTPETKLVGSPVFRNPDGTPKSSVTGIVYNISNPSPRVSTLFAQNQGKVYGAASYDKMQILINSKAFQNKSPAEQLKFIWAHENSHISFRKSLEGQYGPKAKALADASLAWVNSADPQARKNVEDVVRELHLDPELAQLDGIRDVLNNPDPQEWLANVWAMYALGTLKPNNSKAAFSMLPRPIRDFFDWAVSGIQNLAKGAQMWARLSGKDYKAAKDMKELMNTVRRSFRQAEWDAAQAEKFLDIEPSSMIERGNEFAFAQSQENDLDRMGQVGEQKVTDWRTFKRQMGNLWNKAIQPAHTLANSHKEFVEPVLAMYNAPLDTDNAIGDVFKVVVGELDGRDKVQITNKAFERVQKSESLLKLANAIMIRAEVKNQRMIKLKDDGDMVEVVNFDALSPEQRGQFQQFSPEAQQALATYIAQAERANIMTQKKNLESTWSEITSNLALLLTSKSSFNKDDFKKAPAIAEGMLKDLQLGDTEGAVSKLVGLDEFDRAKLMEQTQQLYAEYAKLEKFYNERPTYMSFKRFGDIRQRISKPGEQDDVVDADTELELQEKLKPYLADGWTQTNARIPKKERKNQEYRVNSDLLKLMNDREKLFKNMIQESGTISDEDKNMILNYPSSSDAMISEINSRELYKPTTGRKRTGDLARYDWYEQFVKYTPAAISSAQRRALSAKINFWMQDPALLNKKLQKDQFMALYEQSRNPDPEWVRKVNKLNAVWHIGWNLPGHIAELFQPMVAMLPELQAKGESLPGALKLIQKAERDVVKMHGYRLKDKLFRPDKAEVTVGGETFEGLAAMWIKANGTSKETVDEARMLHEKRGRIQKAPLSEIRDFTGENQIRLEDSMVGRTMSKLKDAVTRPFHTYASAAMGFYSNFTQHNGVVSLITSYRKFRKQGLSHEEAMQKAELFDLTVNNSGGRLERSELYGKLGSIGPLVLGLSSYTRGRFSQLATFYRHGFNSKQFEGKLSNAEIANAKKAFQTMILAQVGAAGLLGLPFVGAGIALMEELLGEDIKGKMLTALDEVTNDPTLSRVFSHGMMSAMAESFGVPADLHSRFALSSFLGTNSYDGISAKSFMGPSVAMLDSMFNLGSELAKGESMEKALTVAGPGGVKRLAEAISEDFQRDNPEANLASSMLGFRSSQMVKRKEWDQITRKQELEGRRDLEKSAMEISKKMEINPRLARQQLLIEADKLVPQGLDRQGIVNQRQQNIKDLIQKVSLLQADKVGPQDPRRQVSGRVAPIASQTAQAMGVQMQNPMELARAMAQQKTRSQLGATSSQRPVRNAMLQEMQWSRNPWEF